MQNSQNTKLKLNFTVHYCRENDAQIDHKKITLSVRQVSETAMT